jgi:hypothetical protein
MGSKQCLRLKEPATSLLNYSTAHHDGDNGDNNNSCNMHESIGSASELFVIQHEMFTVFVFRLLANSRQTASKKNAVSSIYYSSNPLDVIL